MKKIATYRELDEIISSIWVKWSLQIEFSCELKYRLKSRDLDIKMSPILHSFTVVYWDFPLEYSRRYGSQDRQKGYTLTSSTYSSGEYWETDFISYELTKERLTARVKSILSEWKFKDRLLEQEALSDIRFEDNVSDLFVDFDKIETKKRERIKIPSQLLVWWNSSWITWFAVPVWNTISAEKRYNTVKEWIGSPTNGFMKEIENTPIKWIKRLWVQSRSSTSNKFVEYLDPRGFVLQLSAESSNELTKWLEELGTSLEDTECVWDCSWRSPKILPIKLYSIDFQNGDLSSETQRKYIKPRSKKEKFHLRVLNWVYLWKYKTLDIQSVEKPGLIILLNLINKSLVYLSHSQFVELYSRDIEHLNIDFSLDFDKLYSIERSVIESLVKSWRFIEADSFIEEVLEMK